MLRVLGEDAQPVVDSGDPIEDANTRNKFVALYANAHRWESEAADVSTMLSVRTRSIYFIMLTFAFAQMLFYLAVGQQQFGGDDGMPLARRSQFGGFPDLANPRHFYCFALVLLVGVLVLCDRIVRSRFGMVLRGCMQNDTRLQTIGVATYWYKVAAFSIAGAIAGLAGCLVANLNAYVSPNFLDWKVSGDVIMMIVVGGIGTLHGAPIGALVFLLMQEGISPVFFQFIGHALPRAKRSRRQFEYIKLDWKPNSNAAQTHVRWRNFFTWFTMVKIVFHS
jgi:branched-chain amino acid transport system permease protein